MSEEIECQEGEEAAERFREITKKIMSVPKSEIDKRSGKDRAKRERAKSDNADD
jgi:hypothetical protein